MDEIHRLVLIGIRNDRLAGHFLVVTFKSGKIFTGLRELTFLHALTDVPVDKGTLGVHEVELVVETTPGLGDGRGV